jgi:Zn-dependent peptidase ImmA (M78 family)
MKHIQLELQLKTTSIHPYQVLDTLCDLEETLSKNINEKPSCMQYDVATRAYAKPPASVFYSAPSGNPYANIDPDIEDDLEKKSKLRVVAFDSHLLSMIAEFKMQPRLSDQKIKFFVRKIHKSIWQNRNQISELHKNIDPIKLLNPEITLAALGYTIRKHPTLGAFSLAGRNFEVAGQIDQKSRTVDISQQFSNETQYFTAAHELAHAFLHEQSFMHRDRPLNGATRSDIKDAKEWQADRFATHYLMPEKLIKNYFFRIFHTHKFVINQLTANALNIANEENLKNQVRDLRSLSRMLASTTFYNSKPIRSLSEIFNVSCEAMAIRLEELELVVI